MQNDERALIERVEAEQAVRKCLARAKEEFPMLADPDGTVAVPIEALDKALGPDWEGIETMPRDWTISMVAWPHPKTDSGWMLDFWSGKYLAQMEDAIARGQHKNSPHLFWLPTHWKPNPIPPPTPERHPR